MMPTPTIRRCVRTPLLLLGAAMLGAADADAVLPAGVTPVWDSAKAAHVATPTREMICLNGLWRWQPERPRPPGGADVPGEGWGYFKVPGCWPGITDYLQSDSQLVYGHPSWKGENLGALTAAWYQREISIPSGWSGRRIAFQVDDLNSLATVYVDGTKAGEVRFPGGELELGTLLQAGTTHLLSLHTIALPLKSVMLSFSDTSAVKEVKGAVARRGLCGDVWLTSEPATARLGAVRIETSYRNGQISIEAALNALKPGDSYQLQARILDHDHMVQEFSSPAFTLTDLSDGHYTFAQKWKPDRLWDITTPQNTFQLGLTLVDGAKKTLDSAFTTTFGFRELWIDGRDFYLNGTRIFLSAGTLDNAGISVAASTYAAAKESMLRLQSIGVNFVYTHNYGCEPGTHLGFTEILKAADDVGMLVALSQPHFGQYDWKTADADEKNGYLMHARHYVQVAGNHPSIVFYAMSHNGTGYNEEIDPDRIDGIFAPRDYTSHSNVKQALRAEAIVHRLDPGRIVYHHSSGNLGSMHTMNFYLNFVPIQEMSDWFEHWSTTGVKPVFLCEFGVPYAWDWTMYRGWYKGVRTFGSAKVPWEFCVAEWDSQFLGDRAFQITEFEKEDIRFEAKKFRTGTLFFRWDYPYEVGTSKFADRQTVRAMYLTDNFRAFRMWGLSANTPSELESYWTLREGLERNKRVDLATAWDKLQQPGFSPDFIEKRFERMDQAYARSDWIPTPAALALVRNNRPLLGCISGAVAHVTSKDHNLQAGEVLEKQLIVINNSRAPVSCALTWSLGALGTASGSATVSVETGQSQRIPLSLTLPATLAPGSYDLKATFAFANGETQTDQFQIDVAPKPGAAAAATTGTISLYDPSGETAATLDRLNVHYHTIDATTPVGKGDILVIGKAALTVNGPAPDVRGVRTGGRVLIFEQKSEVLEKRFGFRIEEYGLRQVFKRIPDHALLAGIETASLHDWNGDATLLPPRLASEPNPRYYGAPTVAWCGMDVTRLWRCGNRGDVASVLIEKPTSGDFLPVLDGGFSLQYTPLVEYREGSGLILFCQADVTGRSTVDPAADALCRNLIKRISSFTPAPSRVCVYIGDPAGKEYLGHAGVPVSGFAGTAPAKDQILVIAPGAGKELTDHASAIRAWITAGGALLAIGLDAATANQVLPFTIATTKTEHIASFFEPPSADSPFAGIGPADVQNRDPRDFPLITGGAAALGDGILAKSTTGTVVFCQLTPWAFDYSKQYDIKRTFRRSAFVLSRLLANLGVHAATTLLDNISTAVDASKGEKRWLNGLYLDIPEDTDDPYRFFGW